MTFLHMSSPAVIRAAIKSASKYIARLVHDAVGPMGQLQCIPIDPIKRGRNIFLARFLARFFTGIFQRLDAVGAKLDELRRQ
jgi:hypothetical protein